MTKYSNLFFAVLCIWSVVGCSSDDTIDLLTGEWKLIETLMDPGDGSGTYQPYEDDQVATFFADSTVRFSKEFCNTPNGEASSTGVVSGNQLVIANCDVTYTYELKDGYLYIYPQCIEPCGLKFEKMD